MGEEKISFATIDDLTRIDKLFHDCKEALQKKEIYQWDVTYPDKEYFSDIINEKELFILHNDAEILGAMVLNEWQVSEWEDVPMTSQISQHNVNKIRKTRR